jgi:hypothetical protein
VTEQGNWVGFLVVLLNDLCNRPIEWPVPQTKLARAVYNRMMAARSGRGHAGIYPQSLALELKDGHEGQGFYYNIVVKQDGPHAATLVGLLASTNALRTVP